MAGLHFCNPCCKGGEDKEIKEFREFKEFNETGHSHSDLKRPIATYSDLSQKPTKKQPQDNLELWPTGCTKNGGKQRYLLYAVLVLLFVAAAKDNANRKTKIVCLFIHIGIGEGQSEVFPQLNAHTRHHTEFYIYIVIIPRILRADTCTQSYEKRSIATTAEIVVGNSHCVPRRHIPIGIRGPHIIYRFIETVYGCTTQQNTYVDGVPREVVAHLELEQSVFTDFHITTQIIGRYCHTIAKLTLDTTDNLLSRNRQGTHHRQRKQQNLFHSSLWISEQLGHYFGYFLLPPPKTTPTAGRETQNLIVMLLLDLVKDLLYILVELLFLCGDNHILVEEHHIIIYISAGVIDGNL